MTGNGNTGKPHSHQGICVSYLNLNEMDPVAYWHTEMYTPSCVFVENLGVSFGTLLSVLHFVEHLNAG